ncbi:MAG: DUF1127 domain-containing protein [Rhodospirillales bacterium]|jgi:uncharacterized protein YjiS (DUF1127 family)
MNKLSTEQTELATEEMVSIVALSEVKPLTMEEVDLIIRNARLAQAEVAVQMFKAVASYIGNMFAAIRRGINAATTYDELARLSDRQLADIGISRDQIASVAFNDVATRTASANLSSYGYSMKIARPTNDWVDHIAA